jgi:capsid protein
VITDAVASGLLDAPGFFEDARVRRSYLNAHWHGDPPGHIDPFREVSAVKTRYEMGVGSIARAHRELLGVDWEAEARQRAREQALFEELGITEEATASVEQQNSVPTAPDTRERN